MKRGTITLTKEELNQLLSILDTAYFGNTQLQVKLNSTKVSSEENINILLSEDEIEKILDQAGPPIYENQTINNAILKIQKLMLTLREQS